MGENGFIKKVGNKIGSGVLFVAACFVAMYILMRFHGNIVLIIAAAILLVLSAFLFLNALFADKAKEWIPEDLEEAFPRTGNEGDGEFRLKITKHMKEMENSQRELIDILKSQNAALQAKVENLENVIFTLSEKQVAQAKSIIKYNKENARQLAISERETLEHVMQELKQAIEDNAGGFVAGAVTEKAASALEEVSEEELFAVSDLPGDEEYVMPELPVPEAEPVVVPEPVEEIPMPEAAPVEEIPMPEAIPAEETPVAENISIPELPEDIDLSEIFDIPELEDVPAEEEIVIPEMPADIEIPVPEEIVPEPQPEPEPVPAPATDPMAGLSSDPGAMMSPEDIAKLLEAMGR